MTTTLNPSDYQYCVTIKPVSAPLIYGLTNNSKITYGDLMKTLMNDVHYRVAQSVWLHHNICFVHNDTPIYKLDDYVRFEDNKAYKCPPSKFCNYHGLCENLECLPYGAHGGIIIKNQKKNENQTNSTFPLGRYFCFLYE